MGVLKGSGWAGRLKRVGVAAALLWAVVGVSLASAQDQTPPNLVRASVNGDKLTLTFDEDLAPPALTVAEMRHVPEVAGSLVSVWRALSAIHASV